MTPLADALAGWHEYYMLLGTASGTLVGLLFVAASVGGSAFSTGATAPLRVFLSASVINFATVLIACLIVLAPVASWLALGAMIGACGMFGLGFYALTWRDMVRDGLNQRIDWDDRIWYAVLPVVAHLVEAGAGVAIASRRVVGCEMLAVALGALLVVGVHNAWDITVWSIRRQRD